MSKTKAIKTTYAKYWYLGFLGFIGLFYLSEIRSFFLGEASIWALSHSLWFLWFSYFIPKNTQYEHGAQ